MTRTNLVTLLIMMFCILAFSSEHASADEPADVVRAKKFWITLASGDVDAVKAYYAPKVHLIAGSELLKPQWGVGKEGDRSKGLLVDRDDLLRGYTRMIKAIGKDKWSQFLAEIDREKINVGKAEKGDKPFAGVKRGDTVLVVATGPGDDTLFFILRKDKDGMLLVHLEATDY